MHDSLAGSIVRIVNSQGSAVGAGFLISDRHICTCAHVVDDALGRDRNIHPIPETNISFDFPLSQPNSFYQASVIIWHNQIDKATNLDIAILQLVEAVSLPERARPIRLQDAESSLNHNCYAFGFPEYYQQLGQWAEGKIINKNAYGWIQIGARGDQKHFFSRGYSGSPVWDEEVNAVVGMLVAADSSNKIAAMIPTDILANIWPKINKNYASAHLFNVPQLPPHYLERNLEIARAESYLINKQLEPTVISSAQQTTMLQGMGGIGKTVIACALARSELVQQRYVDGIIWVTLGQQPEITQKLVYVGQCLKDNPSNYSTYSGAKTRLAEILSDKNCLIILDDVWDITHVDVFSEIIGHRCSLLVTTRDARLATSLGANQIRLDVLEQDSAMMLLADWANINRHELHPEAELILNECGYLPFAIALCGAMARDGVLWSDILEALQEADLSFIEMQFPNYPYPDILRALKVSLDILDENAYAHYKTLAVFPEDSKIPEDTILLFWLHMGSIKSARNGRKMLSEFDRRALLRLEGQPPHRYVSLHDLHHDYLITVLESLTGMHLEILTAYKGSSPDGWYSGPNDGYFFDYLAYHLLQAGRGNELVATLKDLRYIARKTFLSNSLAVETDFELAQKFNPDDQVLEKIKRQFINLGYLLNRGETLNEVVCTLFTHIKHIPDLASQSTGLKQIRKSPFVDGLHDFPDLVHPALIRTIEPHNSYIWSCALSSDSLKVVSGSSDNTVKICSIETGAILQSLVGHGDTINTCIFNINDKMVMSGSDDKTIKVWDAENGNEVFAFEGHKEGINALCIHPYENILVSASKDHTLMLWDLISGRHIQTFCGHQASVTDCAIDEGGNWLISSSIDQTVKVWDLKTKTLTLTFSKHNSPVTACDFGPDGETVLSSSSDGMLILWKLETEEILGNWHAHRQPISACCLSKKGALAASSSGRQNVLGDSSKNQIESADHTVKLWDPSTTQELQCYQGHSRRVTDCDISKNGKFVISASRDGTLKVWDVHNRQAHKEQQGHVDWIHSCKVSPGGNLVVTSSDDSTVRIWNPETGLSEIVLIGHEADVNDCAISNNEKIIVTASRDCTAKVWDSGTGKELLSFSGHTSPLWSCSIHPNGHYAVTGSYDHTLKIWMIESGEEVVTLKGHSDRVRGCAYSNDGKYIVSTSNDNTVKLWDSKTGQEIMTFEGHTGAVCRCEMSTDNSFVVSASEDNTIKIWSVANKSLTRTLYGHTDQVRGCAIMPDQKHIISASLDRSLKIWNIDNGECVASLYLNDHMLNCAPFPDNRKFIATGTFGVYFLYVNWEDS